MSTLHERLLTEVFDAVGGLVSPGGTFALRYANMCFLWHPNHGQMTLPLPRDATNFTLLEDERLVYSQGPLLFVVF
jgi:hypothetical protein